MRAVVSLCSTPHAQRPTPRTGATANPVLAPGRRAPGGPTVHWLSRVFPPRDRFPCDNRAAKHKVGRARVSRPAIEQCGRAGPGRDDCAPSGPAAASDCARARSRCCSTSNSFPPPLAFRPCGCACSSAALLRGRLCVAQPIRTGPLIQFAAIPRVAPRSSSCYRGL
jgi:hypothetical protein